MTARATERVMRIALLAVGALVLPAVFVLRPPVAGQTPAQRVEVAPADGGYVITAPAYRARVSAEGRLTSLRLAEIERLRESGLGMQSGGQPAALTPVTAEGTTVTAGDAARSIAYTFEESGIRLRVQHAGDAAVVLPPAPETRHALRFDDGAPAGSEKLWTWERWVAADGSAITLRPGPRYSLVRPPEEPVELPVPASGTLTARLEIEPAPGRLDRVEGLVISHDADHVFRANEIPRFSVRLTNANPDRVNVVVRTELKSYDGRSLDATTTPETVDANDRRTVAVKYDPLPPGFYDLAVTVGLPEGPERRTELTFGTQTEAIRPPLSRERDFRAFWQRTLAELKAVPMNAVVTPDSARSTPQVRVSKVEYTSLGDRHVYGWFCAPAAPGRRAALLVLPGYGDGPVAPPLALAQRGYAALAIQIRGHDVENGAYRQPARYMTEGIDTPESYAYRFIDAHCVRGIDFLASRPGVDAERIGVIGGSQGGGLSVVTAALDRRVRVAAPDVPFLCDFPVAVEVAGSPYREIADAVKAHPERRQEIHRVLSYFDAMNHAPDVRCPVLFSASLRDRTCPAPTIVAAYNQLPGRTLKEIHFLPFAGHTTTTTHAQLRAEFVDAVLQPQVVR